MISLGGDLLSDTGPKHVSLIILGKFQSCFCRKPIKSCLSRRGKTRIISHVTQNKQENKMTVPLNVSSHSYAPVVRRNTTYRGGFRTSICDLFANPARRADCCALSCCGVLQSDKNRFLLNGERPSWCKRIALNFILPFVALIVMLVVGGILVSNDKDSALMLWWPLLTWLTFLGIVVALCIRGRRIRMHLRRDVMNRMYQDSDGAERHLFAPRYGDSCCAQLSCFGCYPNDVTFSLYDPHDDNGDHEEEPRPDFCTRIFQNVGALCCGVCCQTWCMFCGMCAIAQEERELSALIPKNQQMIDYMTFEVSNDCLVKASVIESLFSRSHAAVP